MPGTGYNSSVGVQREDARTPSGAMAGSDPDFMITDHLDRFGIDFAILTGSHVLGISVHTDPDWGNAVATAYNRNLAERWLGRSARFRGSIVVNHSDPEAAAREIRRCAPDKRFVQVLMAKQQKAVGVQQSPEFSDQFVGQRLGDIESFDGQAQLGR
jgi:predicted TIM-barrel fold metal-dependent hydrolase